MTDEQVLRLPIARRIQLRNAAIVRAGLTLKEPGGGNLRKQALEIIGERFMADFES